VYAETQKSGPKCFCRFKVTRRIAAFRRLTLEKVRVSCRHCDDHRQSGKSSCSHCGALFGRREGSAPFDGDTIHLPDDEPVVRPALAVLYRLAVGPAADYYAPRFLRYERAGHALPGWHWPAFVCPSVWAFYRKLWIAGIAYALLPALGALAFANIGPRIDDSTLLWSAAAVLAVWVLPGILPALLANSLLYRRVRRVVGRAEAAGGNVPRAARMLSKRKPTSVGSALLLGGGILALAFTGSADKLREAYVDHAVRATIGQSLSAVRWLQQEVEEEWWRFGVPRRPPELVRQLARQSAPDLADVTVSETNGRVRLGLGRSIPELAGKAILLAPSVDAWQRVHWLCIPIDIPKKYLPKECRQPG
jgi:hypothetical protein